MSNEARQHLEQFAHGKIGRREFLQRMSLLGLSSIAVAILDACAPVAAPTTVGQPQSAAPTSAPAPTTAPAAMAGAAVLTVGMEAAIPNLDPAQILGLHSMRVTRLVNETLVTTKPTTTEVIPLLAESWETSDDGTQWTFHLRKNVMFSDGTPLTAEAVKQTYERTVFPDNPLYDTGTWSFTAGYLQPLEQAVAVDDTTVRLDLKYPLASLLAYLALPNFGVMSLKAMQDKGEDIASEPVGTGPYVLTNWERGTRIELTRNEDYWGTPGQPEKIIFRPLPEAQARVAALLSGDVDVIIPVPPDSIEQIDNSGKARVIQMPGLTSWFMALDIHTPPLDDVKVRQALNYAVDKEAIVRDVLKGTGTVAQGPIPPSSWAFDPTVEKYEYDPEKAKSMLADAGYADGFTVDMWVPESGSGMQEPQPMAQVIQANLAAVGVTANMQVMEWGSYLAQLRQEAPDLAALSWFLKSEDPDLSLFPLFNSASTPLPNVSAYNNPEVDKLLVDARSALDRDERIRIYQEILHIVTTDAPWIFVDHGKEIIGVRSGVEDVTINPDGFDLRVETATIS